MHPKPRLIQRFIHLFGTVLVLALSLILLGYVGLGEAYRTYPRFRWDTLVAQGEIVKASMQSFLLAGLPLEQFPGFATLTRPLLASDRSIAAIALTDHEGKPIFAHSQPDMTASDAGIPSAFGASKLQGEQGRYQVTETTEFYLVTLGLSSKFGDVGSLQLITPKSAVANEIHSRFAYVVLAGGAILCVYALFVWLITHPRFKPRFLGVDNDVRWLGIAYGLAFLLMAVVVIGTLINLYADGVQAKTESLARSLQLRLHAPLELGLDLADFDGLERTFKDYQALNPDISYIALTRDQQILVGTDPGHVGSILKPRSGEYEYRLPLGQAPGAASLEGRAQTGSPDQASVPSEQLIVVHVAIPARVVYAKLWRSVKNFVVLFVASAFLSLLFLNLLRSFTQGSPGVATTGARRPGFELGLIRPFYFLSVFVEGLMTSFLPQYFQGLARASNVDPGVVSTLFTVYFAAFVVALIPAGRLAERRGNRLLLIAGAGLVALSLLLMAVVTSLGAMIAIRALAGIGQGVLYIGVQSYILEVAEGGHKTEAAAIVVYGYNGGMISGTAIGALLAVYTGTRVVFILAGAIALLLLPYVIKLIPRPGRVPAAEQTAVPGQGFMSGLAQAVRDLQLVKSVLLIGIPAKAILTGVTIFALPLILAGQDYAQEDIGQIMMLYSAGVLLSTMYVSRLVDRIGKTTRVLFLGAFVSGCGLILIGLMGLDVVLNVSPYLSVLLVSLGMSVLGVAHGFIHAPIITHISNTTAAMTLGKSMTTSLYRFLERIGHMAGPMLVSYILLLGHGSAFSIAWIGVAVIGMGLLFALSFSPRAAPAAVSEQRL